MKVIDLIKKLEKFPKNHEVIIVSKKKWEKEIIKSRLALYKIQET